MADVAFVKSKEKSAGRAGAPTKGFDAGGCKYNVCPSDSLDLHGDFAPRTRTNPENHSSQINGS